MRDSGEYLHKAVGQTDSIVDIQKSTLVCIDNFFSLCTTFSECCYTEYDLSEPGMIFDVRPFSSQFLLLGFCDFKKQQASHSQSCHRNKSSLELQFTRF